MPGMIPPASASGGGFDYTDNTALTIDSGGDYTTLKAAMDDLNTKSVQPGKLVTVTAGDYATTETGSTTWSNPFGAQFLFTSASTASATLSTYNSTGGAAGAWTALNSDVSSTAGITTSHFALIRTATGGTYPWNMRGCWPISAVDVTATDISITNTSDAWAGAAQNAPTNWGYTGGAITYLKSVFDFSGVADHAITVKYGCVLRMDSVVIKGHASYAAVYCDSGALFLSESPMGINGPLSAICLVGGSRAIVPGVCVGGCASHGLDIRDGSHATITGGSINGSIGSGAFVDLGTVQFNDACLSGNAASGIDLQPLGGASARAGSGSILCGNGGVGMIAGFASGGYGIAVNASYNMTYGARGQFNAHVRFAASTLVGNGTAATQDSNHTQVSNS